MKPKSRHLRSFALASSALLSISYVQAATFTWNNSNVTGTPTSTLDWFTGGPNALGLWTGAVVPVSNNANAIQFFQNTTTALTNTATPSTQTSNINNGGAAFQLGTLTLSGLASATTNANLTMTISGDALNFSAATGKINLDALNATRTITYNVNSAIQLGTASSAGALTLTGNGTSAFNFGGIISELQSGGGSLIKSGTSSVTLTGANTYTGATIVNAGTLTLGSGANGSLSSSSTLQMGGSGTFTYSRTGAGQTVNGLTVNGGGTTVNNTSTGQTLTLGAITRTASQYGVVNFATLTGPISTTTGNAGSTGIIGAWATTGSGGTLRYAIGSADGVTPTNITALTGTMATAGTLANLTDPNGNYEFSANATTVGNLTANTLRYSGTAVSTVNIGASNTLTLNGLLNASTSPGTLTIQGGPSTGGIIIGATNELVINGAGRSTTISSVIADGASAGRVVVGSGAALTLSGVNTFSGGLILNGGTVSNNIANVDSLGAVGGIVTLNATTNLSTGTATFQKSFVLNNGAMLNVTNGATANTITGAVTGTGGVGPQNAGSIEQRTLSLTSLSNTFTGPIMLNWDGGNNSTISVNSLSDAPGAGAINLSANASSEFMWGTGAVTPLVLNNRQFVISTNSNANLIIKNANTNAANTITVNTGLLITGTGNETLTLAGVNTGNNVIAGNISYGPSGVLNIVKNDAGTWRISSNITGGGAVTVNAGGALTLSGTNTYSGNTSFVGSVAQLVLAGSQAASPNTTFLMNTGASTQTSTIKFLDDTGGVNGGTATFGGTYRLQSNNTPGITNNFIVGNNNTANGGTSSGTTTGSTIVIGTLNWNTVANGTTNVGNIAIQGANGYRLQINNVVMFNGAGHTAGNTNNTNFTPTTANVTLGTVTQATGNAVNGVIPFLVLGGTSSDNRITGAISNASDVGTSLRPVNVTKSSTSTWTLEGTNTYTGATSVTGGLLRFTGDSSAAVGNVSVTGGALGGNAGSLGGAVTVSSTGGINLQDGSVGGLTLGSTLNITGAAGANNLRFDLGNTTGTSDSLVVAGATTVTTTGAAVINLNQLGGTAGRTATTYTLIGGAGTLAGADFAKFSLATTAAFGQTYALTNTGDDLQVVATNVTSATPAAFWAGGGTPTNNWSTTTNWRDTLAGGGAVAGAPDYQTNVTFSTTAPAPGNLTTNVLDVDFNINSLTLTNASGNVTIGGSTKMLTIEAAAVNGNTLGNGIDSQKTSGTNTISAKVGLASSQTWTVAGGGTLAVSGAISDFGAGYALTKAGGGTLTLTGATTYTGGTTITGGIASFAAASTGALNAGPISLSGGGRLTLAGANASSASQFSVGTGGGLLFVNKNNNFTTSGKLTGSGQLSLLDGGGAGTLSTYNFNSTENDFTGGVVLNAALFNVNSLANSANNIAFNTTGSIFTYGSAATAPLALATRAIELNSAGALTGTIQNNSTSQAISIGGNLVATGAGAKILGLGAVSGPSNVYSGAIVNATDAGSGTVGVTKTGVGAWTLSNTANTFGGTITVSDGTLAYASAGGGNGIAFTNTTGSATLSYTGAAKEMTGAINAGTVTSGTVNLLSSGAGAVNYSNTTNITAAGSGNRNLVLAGTNTGDNTLAGGWVNNTGGTATLTKNDAGTWILASATNTYTGATNVNAGKLLVNGTTGTSAFSVASGATLGGTGTIGGTVNVTGVLSPGASIESLTTGALTMASGSAFVYEVADNTATGADMLGVNGALTLTNVNLTFDLATVAALSNATWSVGNKLTLISYTGTAITSGFAGYTDDTNYTFGSNVWTFNYNDIAAGANFDADHVGSSHVTLTAFTVVPEPSTALLTALGVLVLLRRRR